MFAAGYDISSEKGYLLLLLLLLLIIIAIFCFFLFNDRYMNVMAKFDEIVGMKYLRGMLLSSSPLSFFFNIVIYRNAHK